MPGSERALDVDDLLKVVLVLVIVHVAVDLQFEVVGFLIGALSSLVDPLVVVLAPGPRLHPGASRLCPPDAERG